MTWHETRARWRILREIAAASDHDPTGALPWNDEYAEVFGDRESLVAALRYRWTVAQQAQLDVFLIEPVLGERLEQPPPAPWRRAPDPQTARRREVAAGPGACVLRAGPHRRRVPG